MDAAQGDLKLKKQNSPVWSTWNSHPGTHRTRRSVCEWCTTSTKPHFLHAYTLQFLMKLLLLLLSLSLLRASKIIQTLIFVERFQKCVPAKRAGHLQPICFLTGKLRPLPQEHSPYVVEDLWNKNINNFRRTATPVLLNQRKTRCNSFSSSRVLQAECTAPVEMERRPSNKTNAICSNTRCSTRNRCSSKEYGVVKQRGTAQLQQYYIPNL